MALFCTTHHLVVANVNQCLKNFSGIQIDATSLGALTDSHLLVRWISHLIFILKMFKCVVDGWILMDINLV
jgi:hypothetical protein